MWEAPQILNHLYALTLVGSLLAILTLRIVTGSTKQQIVLIRAYRASIERASYNCLHARAAALSLANTGTKGPKPETSGNVVSILDPSAQFHQEVEAAEQLMRKISALPKSCGEMRVSHLRRNLRTLKTIEVESAKLLAKLETARR